VLPPALSLVSGQVQTKLAAGMECCWWWPKPVAAAVLAATAALFDLPSWYLLLVNLQLLQPAAAAIAVAAHPGTSLQLTCHQVWSPAAI
jgi:hypothetical protein